MGNGITARGYEGRTVADLVDFARSMGAEWVVDVRLNPISRKAGFSKKSLAATLAAAGLQYLHLPGLGNPKDNRAGFADGTGADGRLARDRYRTEVITTEVGEVGLERLAEPRTDGGGILLCFEADARTCHRAEVELALHAMSVASVPR